MADDECTCPQCTSGPLAEAERLLAEWLLAEDDRDRRAAGDAHVTTRSEQFAARILALVKSGAGA
jgi:hypothetical protein